MNHDQDHTAAADEMPGAMSTPHDHRAETQLPEGGLRVVRWLTALTAALLWFTLVYGLPLQTLRESGRISKDELIYLLQAGKPDAPAILDAFDRATEQVLLAVAGPHFILGIAMLFVVAHLVALKRRLHTAERNLQNLRDVVLGIEGVALR